MFLKTIHIPWCETTATFDLRLEVGRVPNCHLKRHLALSPWATAATANSNGGSHLPPSFQTAVEALLYKSLKSLRKCNKSSMRGRFIASNVLLIH